MTKRIAAFGLVLGTALALPGLAMARPLVFVDPLSASERSAIADLDGMTIPFLNFAASGFAALPVGQHYGIKDHALVVVDSRSGEILHLVQALSSINGF